MSSEEVMEKKSIMQKEFRRSSSVDAGDKVLLIEVDQMPTILNRMGQKINEKQLMDFINGTIDVQHTGYLDYDKFRTVCEKFMTDPAILDKIKGDDFLTKHLITREDFDNA